MIAEADRDRLDEAKETLKTWLTDKGVTVPQGALIDALVALLEEVQTGGGVDTTTANPPAAADMLSGREAWANGEKVTGSMPTASAPTPTISVSSEGLITASVSNPKGYQPSASTKQKTQQLTTQAAQTITPGQTNKYVYSGRYLTGHQTILGDADLVPGNVKKGVSIFNITGTYDLPGGVDVGTDTTTTNPSDPSEVVSGKEYWVNGTKFTGTMPESNSIYYINVIDGTGYGSYIGIYNKKTVIEYVHPGKTENNGTWLVLKVTKENALGFYNYFYPEAAAMTSAYQEGVDSV